MAWFSEGNMVLRVLPVLVRFNATWFWECYLFLSDLTLRRQANAWCISPLAMYALASRPLDSSVGASAKSWLRTYLRMRTTLHNMACGILFPAHHFAPSLRESSLLDPRVAAPPRTRISDKNTALDVAKKPRDSSMAWRRRVARPVSA